MAFTLAEAVVRVFAPQEELQRDLGKIEGTAERSAGTISDKLRKALNPRLIFAGLLTGAGFAFGKLADIGISHLRDIDEAQARFRAETGASADEAQTFGRAIRENFKTSRFSVVELGDAMVALRREMGLTTNQATAALPVMVAFAKVTGQNVGQAVRDVDDIMDAWSLTIEDMPALLDRLKLTSEETGASVQSMQRVLAFGSGQFQALGLSLDQTIALMGKMAQAGIAPESALRGLSTAAAKVKSPEEFQKLLKALGAIKDPSAKARAAIELFGARAGPALARLIGPSGLALDDLVKKIQSSEGTVQRASDVFDESFNTRMELFKRRVTDFAASVAGPLFKALSGLGPFLLGLQAILPVLGGGFGFLTSKVLPKFIGLLRLAPLAIRGILLALGPVGLIITAIGVIIALFVVAWTRNWFGIRDVVARIAPKIKAIIDSIVGAITGAIKIIGGFIGKVIEAGRRLLGIAIPTPMTREERQARAVAAAAFRPRRTGELGAAPPAATKKTKEEEAFLKLLEQQGDKGAKAENKALAAALKRFDLIKAQQRLTIAEEIAGLERIKRAYAKTADERIDLDIKIWQLKNQLIEEEIDKNKQAVDTSLQFIQDRLVAEGAGNQEIVAGFQRVITRIKGMRDSDFGDAKGKAEQLQKVQAALRDFEKQAAKDAADKIKEIRASLTEEIERLTLDEFEIERRALNRRFDQQRAALQAVIGINKNAAALLIQNETARALAIAAINKKEAEAKAQQARDDAALAARRADLARDLAEAEGARGPGLLRFIEAQIRQRQNELALAETEEERLRILREIRDLQTDLIEQANAFDPGRGLRLAIDETLRAARNFREVWLGVIEGIRGRFEQFFEGIRRGEKDALTLLLELAEGIFDEILNVLIKGAAQEIINSIATALKGILPGLIVPEAQGVAQGAAIGTAMTAAGTVVATEIGVGITTAGLTVGLGWTEAIVAAGVVAGAEMAAAISAAAAAFGLFGLARGGILAGRRLAFASAQAGLVATRPTLLKFAEAGGTEIAMPLPSGLTPQGLSRLMREGRGGQTFNEGDVNLTFTGPINASDPRDVDRMARRAADMVRLARRWNHPLFREDR